MTSDGYELTLATNYLGGHKLLLGLLPKLQNAVDPRVIAVSSGGMYTQKASLEDLDWQSRSFDGVVSYAMTKRFQVMMTELVEEPVGKEIRFECMHLAGQTHLRCSHQFQASTKQPSASSAPRLRALTPLFTLLPRETYRATADTFGLIDSRATPTCSRVHANHTMLGVPYGISALPASASHVRSF